LHNNVFRMYNCPRLLKKICEDFGQKLFFKNQFKGILKPQPNSDGNTPSRYRN